MATPKKRGRPSKAEVEKRAMQDAEFRSFLVEDAYNRPHLALGMIFRELVRSPNLAEEALTKATQALVKMVRAPGRMTNTVGLESHIAALTRTCELAKTYPEEMRHRLVSAHDRLKAAEFEVIDAKKALKAAREAEEVWFEGVARDAGVAPSDIESRIAIRVRST